MVSIPDTHKQLLEGPIVVALVTIMPDGQPQVTPVWCDMEDGYIRINTARGRQKDRNLTNNSKVAVLAIDPQNPNFWIEVRGEVADSTEDGAREHINTLSYLYDNEDFFVGKTRPPNEVRVIYRIRPTRVNFE
jgi:PPOX class probable F420-dependent enzyme